MPSDIPEVNLFIDYAKPGGAECLLNGTVSSPVYERPALMSGDATKLRLYFRTLGATADSASVEKELPAGCTIVVAGKPLSNLTSSQAQFFCCSTFTSATGIDGDTCYEADLDLTGAVLLAAMDALGSGTRTISVLLDIEVRNAANSARSTYQTIVNLYRQVYAGETTSGPGTGGNLPLAIRIAPDGSRWQDGVTNDGQPTLTRIS